MFKAFKALTIYPATRAACLSIGFLVLSHHSYAQKPESLRPPLSPGAEKKPAAKTPSAKTPPVKSATAKASAKTALPAVKPQHKAKEAVSKKIVPVSKTEKKTAEPTSKPVTVVKKPEAAVAIKPAPPSVSVMPPAAPVLRGTTDVSLDLLKSGLDAAAKSDAARVALVQNQVGDSAAKKLLEWALLRSDYRAPLSRLKLFLADSAWPGDSALKFKVEQELFQGRYSARDILAHFGETKPGWPQGRMALASALVQLGQIERAHALIRDTWRTVKMSVGNEKDILKRFPGVITRADRKFRMDAMLYKENTSEALRIAKELGGNELLLAQARIAVINRTSNAGALLDAVPSDLRKDPSYVFAKIQLLRRQEKYKEAIALLMSSPTDAMSVVDGDEWWVERRLLARAALELNDYNTAYRLAAHHSSESQLESMEAEFHAGWIALRFLKNPKLADKHFLSLSKDAERPISASRGAYWRARAAEDMGNSAEAKRLYQIAAKMPTTYYGQLSLVKLGHSAFSLKSTPKPDAKSRQAFEQREDIRAVRMLMAIDESSKARQFINHLAKTLKNPQEIALLALIADEKNDVRYSVQVGKEALYRDMPLDAYAFPLNGLPNIPTTNGVERALALAIARQESVFDPNAKSGAGAVGLFQVLPGTARDMAKRHNIPWEPAKITNPSYNMRLGTAYLDKLIGDHSGSYILTFAAYNAGPGRVREWLQRFGDPRDTRTDPIDWVESIPFTETRNYVMRVMENLQVYRARLSGSTSVPAVMDRDLQRGRR